MFGLTADDLRRLEKMQAVGRGLTVAKMRELGIPISDLDDLTLEELKAKVKLLYPPKNV